MVRDGSRCSRTARTNQAYHATPSSPRQEFRWPPITRQPNACEILMSKKIRRHKERSTHLNYTRTGSLRVVLPPRLPGILPPGSPRGWACGTEVRTRWLWSLLCSLMGSGDRERWMAPCVWRLASDGIFLLLQCVPDIRLNLAAPMPVVRTPSGPHLLSSNHRIWHFCI